jgi:CheY-like chemotaxis protein
LSDNRQKILIVDDVGFNIQAILILLKFSVKIDVDYVCVKALNGLEALEIVKKDVEENKGDMHAEKNSRVLIVITIALIAILVGLVGFIAFKKYPKLSNIYNNIVNLIKIW